MYCFLKTKPSFVLSTHLAILTCNLLKPILEKLQQYLVDDMIMSTTMLTVSVVLHFTLVNTPNNDNNNYCSRPQRVFVAKKIKTENNKSQNRFLINMHNVLCMSYNNVFIPCGWRWLTWDSSSTLALIFETYGTFWTSLWSVELWLPSPARKSSFTSWWYSLWTFQAWMPKQVVCPCILPQHLSQCLFANCWFTECYCVRLCQSSDSCICVQCRILS